MIRINKQRHSVVGLNEQRITDEYHDPKHTQLDVRTFEQAVDQ